MNNYTKWIIVALAWVGLATPAMASPIFTADFPLSGDEELLGGAKKIGDDYYFYEADDGWRSLYSAPGLSVIRGVELSVLIFSNDISESQDEDPSHPGVMNWEVSLNDHFVGSWSWHHGDGGIRLFVDEEEEKLVNVGAPEQVTFRFHGLDIRANGDSWDLKMVVSESLQSGAGSLSLGMGTVTFFQDPFPVPEPGVGVLMLSGLGFVVYFRYRTRRSVVAGRRGLSRPT